MKRLLISVLFMLMLVGCVNTNQSSTQVVYNSFKTGEIAYRNGLEIANDLYNQNKITKAEKDEIVTLAGDYRIAFVTASTAFETYKLNPSVSNREAMDVLQENAEELLGEFKRWLYERQ